MRRLLKNIKGLVGAYEAPPSWLGGLAMGDFPVIENAWLAIEEGRIAAFGTMDSFPGIVDWSGLEIEDCDGRYVLPAWCDSHTHLVYAADRGGEFLDRLQGKSYQEIAENGGGILNSARALRAMPESDLMADAVKRLSLAMDQGTGAIEIKSGYGLTVEGELKMLRIIQALKKESPIPIKSTLLACHAVPEGDWNASTWTDAAIKELIPAAIEQGLADYVDAFCETGYFSVEDLNKLLGAIQNSPLKAKVHVNQFSTLGGVAACVEHGALSVDHLEELSDDDLAALKTTLERNKQPVFSVALPGCSHFLGIPFTPVRRLMKAGLPVALASDHNPGSAPSGNMTLVVQLAIIKMGMLPLEAIAAATINGAAAMELSHEVGVIAPGWRANLLITKPLNGLEQIGYRFGENPVEKVLINGVQR
ncbi:MAG: imidazolonepropionase [Flavobacteriales bacterium]|nr:imidazolonepropionase [Flavobacteriales bacterium]